MTVFTLLRKGDYIMSYKRFAVGVFALLFGGVSLIACSTADISAPNVEMAYVTGKKGVYGINLDTQTGKISSKGLLAELEKTRFITHHPTKNVLYVAHMEGEHKTGAKGKVTAFAVNTDTGELSWVNEADTGGRNSAHVEVNSAGTLVAVASFHGSTVSTHKVNSDGSLSKFVDKEKITDPGSGIHKLQSEPRPHSIHFSPDNRFAYVPDLGTDTIYIYKTDAKSGILGPAANHKFKLPAGSGTRHFDFHPFKPFAYVINELSADVTVFARDEMTGALVQRQVVSTLPDDYEGRKWAAEVRLHPSGKFLFASNRAHDSIAVFDVNEKDGTLSLVEFEPMQGRTPRHFTLDPSARWLIVGNQYSDTVSAFSINQETGELVHTNTINLPKATAITF